MLSLNGNKLDFVFVKVKDGFKLQGYRMCPSHLVVLHNLKINYLYYIETHISNPINKILKFLGHKSLLKEFFGAIMDLSIAIKTFF